MAGAYLVLRKRRSPRCSGQYTFQGDEERLEGFGGDTSWGRPAQPADSNMSTESAARSIALAPMGEFSADILSELSERIRAAFGRDVLIAERLAIPSSAFDRSREQWHASPLLRVLGPAKRPEWERLLGIVEVDLYAPGLNFVFGQADERHGVAVFSTARLAAGHADRQTRVRRASIEAVHELGHTYGLLHCPRPDCVMWFSNTLGETDRKGFAFCEQHALELKRASATG